LLRARFVGSGAAVRPRIAPFVGRDRSVERRERWVVKGLGADAPVRIVDRGGQR
jgi:hypothetical protein